uniref:Uncharacterized protein n=1 Tax=Zea mays TaxID=4577 RepID=B7ZZA1_MAIZE|nr:unknown [Zea mays]
MGSPIRLDNQEDLLPVPVQGEHRVRMDEIVGPRVGRHAPAPRAGRRAPCTPSMDPALQRESNPPRIQLLWSPAWIRRHGVVRPSPTTR